MSWICPKTDDHNTYSIQIQDEASRPFLQDITPSSQDTGKANVSMPSSASQQRGLLSSSRVLFRMRGKAVMSGESFSAAASFNDDVFSDLLERDRLSVAAAAAADSTDERAPSRTADSNAPVDSNLPDRGLAVRNDPATQQRWKEFSKRSAAACRARLQMSDGTILSQAQAKYQQLEKVVGAQLALRLTAADVREQARLRNSDPSEIAFPLAENSLGWDSWEQENEACNSSEEQQAPLGIFQAILEPLTGPKLMPIRSPFLPYESLEERLHAISTESAVKAWAAKLHQQLSATPVSKEDALLIEQLVATKAAERRALAKVDKRTSIQEVPFPTLQQLVGIKRFEPLQPTQLRQLQDYVEPLEGNKDIGPSATKPKISRSASSLGWLLSKKGTTTAPGDQRDTHATKSASRPLVVSVTCGFSSWGTDTEEIAAARRRLGPYFESVYAGDWWQSEAGKRELRSVDQRRKAEKAWVEKCAQAYMENWRHNCSSPGVYESNEGNMPCVWQQPKRRSATTGISKSQRHHRDSEDMWACLSGRTGPDTRSAFQVAQADRAVAVNSSQCAPTAPQALSAKGQPTEGAAQKGRLKSEPLAWAELPLAVVSGKRDEELPKQQEVRLQRQKVAVAGKRALPWRLDMQQERRPVAKDGVEPSAKELSDYRRFCRRNRGFAAEVEGEEAVEPKPRMAARGVATRGVGLLRCARHKPVAIKVAEGKWPQTKLINGTVPSGTHMLEVEHHHVFDSQFVVVSWQENGFERTGILSLQEWKSVPGWGSGVHKLFCKEVLAVEPRPRNLQRLAIHKYIKDLLRATKTVAGRSLITSVFSDTQGSQLGGLLHTPSMDSETLGDIEQQTGSKGQGAATLEKAANAKKSAIASALGETLGGLISGGKASSAAPAQQKNEMVATLDGGGRGIGTSYFEWTSGSKHLDLQDEGPGYANENHRRMSLIACVLELVALLVCAAAGFCLRYHVRWSADVDVNLSDERLKKIPFDAAVDGGIEAAMDWGRDNLGEAVDFGEEGMTISASFFDKLGMCCVAAIATGALAGPPLRFLLLLARGAWGGDRSHEVRFNKAGERVDVARIRWYFVLLFVVLAMYPNLAAAVVMTFMHSVSHGSTEAAINVLRKPVWSCVQPHLLVQDDYALYGGLVAAVIVFGLFLQEMQSVEGEKPPDPESVVVTGVDDESMKFLNGVYERMSGALHQGYPVYTRDALMGDREVKLHLYTEHIVRPKFWGCIPRKTEIECHIGYCPWKIPDFEVLLPQDFSQVSAIDVEGFKASAKTLNGRYEEIGMPNMSKTVLQVTFGPKIFRLSTKVPLVSYYVFPVGGFPKELFEISAPLAGESMPQRHELTFTTKSKQYELSTGSGYVYVSNGTSHASALGLVDGCPYIAEDCSRGEEKLLTLHHMDAVLMNLDVGGRSSEFREGDRVVQVDTNSGELVAEGTVLSNLGQSAKGAMAMVRLNWGVFDDRSNSDSKIGIGHEAPVRSMSTSLAPAHSVMLRGFRKEQSFNVGDVIRQGSTVAHVAKSCKGQEVEVFLSTIQGAGLIDVFTNSQLIKASAPEDPVSIGPPATVQGLVQLQGLQQGKYEVGTSVEQVNVCLDVQWQKDSASLKPKSLKLAPGETVEQMTPELFITNMLLQEKEAFVEVTVTLASEHGLQKGAKVSMGNFEQQTLYEPYYKLRRELDREATIFNVTPSSFSVRLSKLLPSELPAEDAGSDEKKKKRMKTVLPERFWKDEEKKRTAWARGCIATGSVLRSGTAQKPNTTSAIVHVTFGAFTMAPRCKLKFRRAGNNFTFSAVTEVQTVRLGGVTGWEEKAAEERDKTRHDIPLDCQIWEQSSENIKVQKLFHTFSDPDRKLTFSVTLPGHTFVKGNWIRLTGIDDRLFSRFAQKKSASRLELGAARSRSAGKEDAKASQVGADVINGVHRIADVNSETVFIETKVSAAIPDSAAPEGFLSRAVAREITAMGMSILAIRTADLWKDEVEIDVTHGKFTNVGHPIRVITEGDFSVTLPISMPKAVHQLSARGIVKNTVNSTNVMVSVTQGSFVTKGTVKVAGASVGAPSRVQPFPDAAPVVLGTAAVVDGKEGSDQSVGNLVPMVSDGVAQLRWREERGKRLAEKSMQPLPAKDSAYPLRYNRAGIITQTMLDGAAEPVKAAGGLDSNLVVARGKSLAGMGGVGGSWEIRDSAESSGADVTFKTSNTMRVHFKKRTVWRPHKDFVFDNLCSFFGVLSIKDGLLMLADVSLDFNTVYIYYSLGLWFFMSIGIFFIFYPPICTWMLLYSIGLMDKCDLFLCLSQISCLKEMYEELKIGKKTNNMVWVVLGEACLESAPQSILQTYCLLLNFKQLVSGGNRLFLSIGISLFNVAKNLATIDFYGVDGVSTVYMIIRIFMRFLEVSSRVSSLAIFGCLLRPEGAGIHQNKQVALPSLIALDAMLVTVLIFVNIPRGGALNVFWGLAGVVAAPPIFNRTFRRFQLAYYFWRLLELWVMYEACRHYSDFRKRVLHTEDSNMKFFMKVACLSSGAFYSLALLAALEAGACKLFCPNRHEQRMGNPMGSILYPVAPWAFDMWRWPWQCGTCCRQTRGRRRIRWGDSRHAFSAVAAEEEFEEEGDEDTRPGGAQFLSVAGARNIAPTAVVVADRLEDKHARKVWNTFAAADLETTEVTEEEGKRQDDMLDNEGDELLLDAVRQGDIMLCRVFSIGKMKPLTLVQSWNGHTPFHLAGLSGSLQMMEILLKSLNDQTSVVQNHRDDAWKRVTVEVGPQLFTPVDYMQIYQPDMADHLGFPQSGDLMGKEAVSVPDRRPSLDREKKEEKPVVQQIGMRLMSSFLTQTIKRNYGKDFVGIHGSCHLPMHIAAAIGSIAVFDDIVSPISGDKGLKEHVRNMRDVYGRTALDYVLKYAPFDSSASIDASSRSGGDISHAARIRERGSYQLLPRLMHLSVPLSGGTFRPSPRLIDESTLLEEIVDALVFFPITGTWILDFSLFNRPDRDGRLVSHLGHALRARRANDSLTMPCEIVLCRTLATHICAASLARALGPPMLTQRVDLDLSGTIIGDEGVLSLSKCLRNLSALRLSGGWRPSERRRRSQVAGQITDVGANHLADALAGRQVSDAAEFGQNLDDGIAKVQLSVLDLRANCLSDSGAAALLVALFPSGGAAARQIRVLGNKPPSAGPGEKTFIQPSQVLEHVPILYAQERQRLESKGEEQQFPPELMQHLDIFCGIDS